MSVREEIAALANATFPQEACGFLLHGGTVAGCTNVAADPFLTFEIAEEDVVRWWSSGLASAVWHSHPYAAAVPSEEDARRAVEAGADAGYLIYSVVDEDLGWYRLESSTGRLRLHRMDSPA